MPCTVVNLIIIGVAGVIVGLWTAIGGVATAIVGLFVLWLRGYVVPGTPRFAPRLVAPLPVDFGHANPQTAALSSPDDDADVEAALEGLIAAGVIEADDELFLDEDFRESWTDRMATLRSADESTFLNRVAAACPADVEGHLHGDRVLLAGEQDVRTSRPVAIAETAAIETLQEWEVPEQVRELAAHPLRNFLQTCPACGGRVEETTIQNCCGGSGSIYQTPEQPVLACEQCDAVVVEL